MKARNSRILFIVIALIAVTAAAALANKAMQKNVSYFRSPTEIKANDYPVDSTFRVGGMVKTGSLIRSGKDLNVKFVVTDNLEEIEVSYTGILPDLFQEGTGAVAKGKLGNDGIFYAKEVLAKHDAKYMPPEVEDALKKSAETIATENTK